MGSNVYVNPPRNIMGNSICAAGLFINVGLSIGAIYYLKYRNRSTDRKTRCTVRLTPTRSSPPLRMVRPTLPGGSLCKVIESSRRSRTECWRGEWSQHAETTVANHIAVIYLQLLGPLQRTACLCQDVSCSSWHLLGGPREVLTERFHSDKNDRWRL